MLIELAPIKVKHSKEALYTARFLKDAELMAEIEAAPLDIATAWAEVMRELHDNVPVIKRVGICFYCGSTEQIGAFCGSCQRVFRS
jgi:hypothetical protein